MTKTPKILLHNADTRAMATQLLCAFPDAEFSQCNSYAELSEFLAKYRPEIVYTVRHAGSPGFPRDPLFQKGGPLWVANGGAGTDHFGEWDAGQVTVTNTAGVAADMMAEFVMGGFLHFTLDVPGLQNDKSARKWNARTVRPLKGQTLLIVGLGHTGRAIAARANAFGMKVIGTRGHPKPMDNIDEIGAPSDLLEMLPQADFVAVSTPLTPGTLGLIGAAEIAAMKRNVVFADVSRGKVVDQVALLNALEAGHLGGAVLDVFETEPLPENSRFWQCKNVIVSPHCSSVYDGWEQASFNLFLANLARWIQRAQLHNIVDPGLGY